MVELFAVTVAVIAVVAAAIGLCQYGNRPLFPIGTGGTRCTRPNSARRIQAMHDAAKRVKKDILVLCHGGPIAEPADAQYVLDHTEGIVGFYGASSMERLPVEPAIQGRVREFGELRLR